MQDEIKRLQNELVNIYQADKDCGAAFEDSEIIAAYEAAIQALKSKSKWIPVTEYLPEIGYRVFVTWKTSRGLDIGTGYYCGDDIWQPWGKDRVTAWQPLPEPYREAEE